MRAQTQKLTTAAVCTALAVIMCAASAYLPLSIMPLYMAAFCIFLAAKRGSLPYGILCAVATVGIMFAMTGLSIKWIFLILMFAPYGIITVFVHKFNYFKPVRGIIRGLIAAAFFNMTFGFVYLIATRVVAVNIDVPIEEWVAKVGGYGVIAVIVTVVFVPLDFIFSTLSMVVLKKIPAPVQKRRPTAADFFASGDTGDPSESGKRYDDVFGYEIPPDGGNTEEPNGDSDSDKRDDKDGK